MPHPRVRLFASAASAAPLTALFLVVVFVSSRCVAYAQTSHANTRGLSHSLVTDSFGVLAAWADAPQTVDSAAHEREALWFAVHTLSLRIDGAPGGGVAERPFVRRLLSSSSRALSVRGWQSTGGSKMALSCVVHRISAELSDGLVHVFEVQRKGHGLALTSHTLQTAAPVARVRENSRSGSKGLTSIRVMSFNIWNYNGNWMARARMIADVIEASGADAVALQEVRGQWHWDARGQQLMQLMQLLPDFLYWHYSPAMFYSDGFEEGLAIISKHPMTDVAVFLLPSFDGPGDDHQRALLHAVVRGACHGIDLTSTHLSLNDKSRWRQASAAASVLQQRRARLQLPQARAAAACLNPNQRARCAPLRLERVYSDDGRQVITGDFNAEAASPTLQPLRGSMADVWAASLFANASSQQMASKSLRAARAHAWGGDCALTHPSLTFPTWSPVKRIDMMYALLDAPGAGGLVAADAWTDGRCPLTCDQKRRSQRPPLCDDVRRLMKAGETLWASDHRALVVNFRCA